MLNSSIIEEIKEWFKIEKSLGDSKDSQANVAEKVGVAILPTKTTEPRVGTKNEPYKTFRKAAVLVPIVGTNEELFIPLMKRTDTGGLHSGQISFPGGKREIGDKNAVETALRETKEEYGWDPRSVNVLGCLDDELTPTGYVVRPVIAHVPKAMEYQPDDKEVASIFHLPMEFLLDHKNECRLEPVSYEGRLYKIFEYRYDGHRIWGLTARILNKIARIARKKG